MDFNKIINSKTYNVLDLLFKLLIVNVLWVVMSTIGLGVLTIMPASIATYVIINSLIFDRHFPIFKSFFIIFKKEYWRAQKLFIALLFIGFIVYMDIDFFYQLVVDQPSAFSSALALLSLFFGFLYLLILIHIGPVYIYFPKLSTGQMIKLSLLMGFRHIFLSIFILLLLALSIVVVRYLPILGSMVVLFSFALFVYLSLRYLRPKYESLIHGSEPLMVSDYYFKTEDNGN